MSSPEYKSQVEGLANFSKRVDIVAVIAGLALGGEFGASLALFGAFTYILADRVEKGAKK